MCRAPRPSNLTHGPAQSAAKAQSDRWLVSHYTPSRSRVLLVQYKFYDVWSISIQYVLNVSFRWRRWRCGTIAIFRVRFHWKVIIICLFKRVGEVDLPWATPCLGPSSFFFKWEENKYFSPYAYCFILKSDLWNPNFVQINSYFILFFLESYFFDEQSKFLDVRFYWNKKIKHRFIYERNLKLSVNGVKFPGEKKKKFVINKVL